MTDREVVTRKLSSLTAHCEKLARRSRVPVEEFGSNEDLRDAACMSLLAAVQDALDIALHVCSDNAWELPGAYGESFEILNKHGVLEESTATALASMAALRNRIAHGYASVDFRRIHGELPDGLRAFERFAAAVAHMLT